MLIRRSAFVVCLEGGGRVVCSWNKGCQTEMLCDMSRQTLRIRSLHPGTNGTEVQDPKFIDFLFYVWGP